MRKSELLNLVRSMATFESKKNVCNFYVYYLVDGNVRVVAELNGIKKESIMKLSTMEKYMRRFVDFLVENLVETQGFKVDIKFLLPTFHLEIKRKEFPEYDWYCLRVSSDNFSFRSWSKDMLRNYLIGKVLYRLNRDRNSFVDVTLSKEV